MTDEREQQIVKMSLEAIRALTQTDWDNWTREEIDLLSSLQRAAIEASVELPV